MTVDFQGLTRDSDRVAVIATVPLTDNEVWTAITPGELLVFQDGLPHAPAITTQIFLIVRFIAAFAGWYRFNF